MGRSPCCDKVGLKKGPWTPEEDQKLLAYIEEHGHGSWRALPTKAGLQRCGKSCRLRWTNYLRPDIKRGKFSAQEEQTIIQLHALLGNRWSSIATHLPKRTDNEIKNHWNTHLKKRLAKLGIDPVTHKPKSDALSSADGQMKSSSNLSHLAQWESARLEAEARLVRESRLRSNHQLGLSGQVTGLDLGHQFNKGGPSKSWRGMWSKPAKRGASGIGGDGHDLESPTSTLCFSENSMAMPIVGYNDNSFSSLELMANSGTYGGRVEVKEEGGETFQNLNYKKRIENEIGFSLENSWASESSKMVSNDNIPATNFVEGFTNLLIGNSDDRNSMPNSGDMDNADETGCDMYEENKTYWNNILNLVNSSPSDSQDF